MKKDKLIKRQIKRLNKKVGKTTTIIRGGGGGSTGSSDFLGLSDTPDSYSGQGSKYVRVNAGATALEFVTLAGGGDLLSTNNLSDLANASTARTNLGLGNVNNTSDANKPISTATQTALDGKANTTHSHAISDVTGLQTALDGKQASGSYASSTHSHAISDVTGLQTALDTLGVNLTPSTDKTINNNYGLFVPEYYEIASGTFLECGTESILEIG